MNYVEHYKTDAEEFDYFEERTGASADDEKRLREYIVSKTGTGSGFLLDAGCGSGWASKSFLPLGWSVISTDLSLKNVSRTLKDSPLTNHYGVVCDSLNSPFKENSIKTIIASEIIEHTVEPEKFISQLFSILAVSGKLIVTTPYKEKLIYTLCIHCNQKTPLHAHLHSFDEIKLLGLGYKAGVKKANYFLFGNKYLIFGRTYIVTKFLPFSFWKTIDSFFNKLLGRPVHILIEYKKEA